MLVSVDEYAAFTVDKAGYVCEQRRAILSIGIPEQGFGLISRLL
jgi:hypothetical protein